MAVYIYTLFTFIWFVKYRRVGRTKKEESGAKKEQGGGSPLWGRKRQWLSRGIWRPCVRCSGGGVLN